MKHVFAREALEAGLAAAQRPSRNEDSHSDRQASLGGLRQRFVTLRVSLAGALMFMASSHAVGRVATAATPARMLVMPFESSQREASIFWLGEGAAVLLADELGVLGVPVIAREERQRVFNRLQVPTAATLTAATVIRMGQLVGASEVVMGSLQIDGDTVVVRVRSITLETGRISRDVVERGSLVAMFSTFERIAHQIVPSAVRVAGERRHPPLAVLENYVKGLLATTPATAVKYLDMALTAVPSFDRARLALWDVYAEQGDHALALSTVLPVAVDSSWSRRARFLAGLSYLNLSRNDEAFGAFRTLTDAQPTAAALNNLGVAQIRLGATAQGGQPTFYFTKAAEADPDDADYFFNVGYAYALAGEDQAATYWLREAVRRNPADGDAHVILGTALGAGGNATEAARERELARRLSSKYDQWEKRPASEGVPKGLERVKDDFDLPHARRVEAALITSEQRDQRDLARFYFDRGRRQFEQENDHQAIDELNRALYLSPYEADAHLLIGRIHLRNGRLREAIDAFKISIWSFETVQAHVALGDAYLQSGDAQAARTEADRAAALDPESSDAQRLLERIRTQ